MADIGHRSSGEEGGEYTLVKDYLRRVIESHGAYGLQCLLDDVLLEHTDIQAKVIDYEA